jgi:hypothetical protein
VSAFREPEPPPANEAPPAELTFTPKEAQSDAEKTWMSGLAMTLLPIGVAGALGAIVSPTAGAVGFLVAAAAAVAWRKHAHDPMVLRVRAGALELGTQKKAKTSLTIPLRDLLNVRLDTKEVRRLQEGSHAIIGVRFDDTRAVASTEHARLELVRREGSPIFLPDKHVAHMEASEWLAKVRVFLRKNGWVPADERDDDEPPESAPLSSM